MRLVPVHGHTICKSDIVHGVIYIFSYPQMSARRFRSSLYICKGTVYVGNIRYSFFVLSPVPVPPKLEDFKTCSSCPQ